MTTTKLTVAALTMALGFALTADAFAAGGRGGNFGGGGASFHANVNHGPSNVGIRSQNIHIQQNQFVQKPVIHQQQFQANHNIQHNVQQNFQQKFQHNNLQFNNRNFVRNVSFAAPNFNRSLVKFGNYHLTHGRKFDFGYCYFGRVQPHWVSETFCQPLGCTIYFDPCTGEWYYWCEPYECYFPVSYCPAGTYAF